MGLPAFSTSPEPRLHLGVWISRRFKALEGNEGPFDGALEVLVFVQLGQIQWGNVVNIGNHNGKSSIDPWKMVDGPTENPWRWNCGIVGRIPELNEWRVLAWDHPRTKWRIFGSKPWLNVPLNDGFMWVLFLTKFDFTDWRVSYISLLAG